MVGAGGSWFWWASATPCSSDTRSSAGGQRFSLLAFSSLGALIEIFITKPHWLGREVVQADLTALTFIVVGGIAPLRVPSTELYKAAAQVLPVLLLTYVVDKRRDFHGAKSPFERVSIFLVVAYMVTAGYITLDVLAYDDAERGYANILIAALAATVVSLTISLLTPPRDARSDAAAAIASRMQTKEAISLKLTLPPHVAEILTGWAVSELRKTPEEVLEALAEELTTNEQLRAFAAGLVAE